MIDKMSKMKKSFILSGIIWAILLIFPLVVTDSYIVHIVIMIGIFAVLALGLEIILGLTGLFSLGHAAFFGMGAYVSALTTMYLNVSFPLAMLLSVIFTALFGTLIGFPALRLKGDYLAIATLGFGEIFRLILINWDAFTRGPMGLPGIPRPSVFGFVFTGRIPYYYTLLILFIFVFYLARRIPKTFLGRAFKSIRDDEDAAAFMGINITKYKLIAFAIGGAYAGLAGSFYAHYITFISPDTFLYQDSAQMLAMVFLGGAGTIIGPVVGALTLVLIPEVLRFLVEWRMLFVGVLMVAMMIFRPQGIMGGGGLNLSGFRKPKPPVA
ncbi:MAG: branched-chain amino acid ABC transporter permease [Clostridia bacterium]